VVYLAAGDTGVGAAYLSPDRLSGLHGDVADLPLNRPLQELVEHVLAEAAATLDVEELARVAARKDILAFGRAGNVIFVD
jgi:hypothetical protein